MRQQVSIVATDIVASSRLWEQHAALAPAVLDLHDRVMRDVFRRHGGYELRTEGDAFRVLFRDPLSAALACLEAQQALARTVWPEPFGAENGLRVRMGVHHASVNVEQEPVGGRMDVRGPAMLRAARVAEAAHGGQVLLTDPSARAVRERGEPTGLRLLALGRWLLSESEIPEELWQVELSDLPAQRWPAPRGRPAPRVPHNLPSAPPLLGREAELHRALEAVLAPQRAVLIHGLVGVGKSALALHLAHRLVEGAGTQRFRGGVWRVDLRAARSAHEATRAVLTALHGTQERGDTLLGVEATLAEMGPGLLLLEHGDTLGLQLDELVTGWLTEAPELQIVATRRLGPSWAGWTSFLLGPLPVPDAPAPGDPAELQTLRAAPALTLMRQSALAARAEHSLLDAPANLPILAQAARRLGGLPLALEIAASWLELLSPAELLARLERDPFALLSDRLTSASHPARSVRQLLDETWVQLSVHHRAALTSLSVFQGGFTMLAASAVLESAALTGAPTVDQTLESLRGRGLLLALDEETERSRWVVVPLVARHALALDEDRAEQARDRHARFFRALAEEVLAVEPQWRAATLSELLDEEEENLCAALGFARERRSDAILSLARVLVELSILHGAYDAGLDYIEIWTEHAASRRPDLEAAQAELTHRRGLLQARLGRDLDAEQTLSLAMSRAAALGLTQLRGAALRDLAVSYLHIGRSEAALGALETARSIAQLTQDPCGEGASLAIRADLRRRAGRWQQALEDQLAAHGLLAPQGLTPELADERMCRARLMRDMSDTQEALTACEEAVEILELLGDLPRLCEARALRALLLWEAARVEEAAMVLELGGCARGGPEGPGRAEEAWTLGLIRAELGQLDAAREAFALAEDLALLSRRTELLTPILVCQAEIELRRKGPGAARPWFERAERAATRDPARGELWLLIGRGRRTLMLGDRIEAVEAAQQARLALDERPDPTADRLLRPLERALWSHLDLHSSSA